MANSFICKMGLNEKDSLPHLLDRISPEIQNEANLIKHSKYYNDVGLVMCYITPLVR